jgi:hypothetical protein
MRRSLSFITLSLALVTTVSAQAPDPTAGIARARAALAPVQRILGTWEGEARVMEGRGEPMRILQSEDIVAGASGTVIIIRGTGRDPNTRATVFEAAATIWFDAESGRLKMRTHRDGRSVEPDIEVRPDTVIWGFAVAGGRVKYVIALTDSTWHEIGTYERAGVPPVTTIDMRLRRTGG